MPLQTPTHDWHVAHGGRMVDFAGWSMPVQYTSISEEHQAVRQAVGLFDIAHMGRLRFHGKDAAAFLDHLLTNDVLTLKDGQIRYALVTAHDGGVIDDVLVYRLGDEYQLVVNASNRNDIVSWIASHQEPYEVEVEDQTLATTMVAIQGPRALPIAQAVCRDDPAELKYYWCRPTQVLGRPALLSRTGYTGEDGVEIVVAAEAAVELWQAVLDAGAAHGIQPAGLGCRDTLRLEAAMPLYGHELTREIDPLMAGLQFAVKLDRGDFIGRERLRELAAQQDRPRRVGLKLEGRRIAREGAGVFRGEMAVGEVTSGTFSPTLEQAIAMAYVSAEAADVGNELEIDIRGRRVAATIVALPFYRRPA